MLGNDLTESQRKSLATLLSRSLLGTIAVLGMLIMMSGKYGTVSQFLSALFWLNFGLVILRYHTESIRVRIEYGRRSTREERRKNFRDSLLGAIPSLIPLLGVAFYYSGILNAHDAINLVQGMGIATLFFIGYISNRLLHAGIFSSLLTGLFDLSIGAMLIAAKYLS